MRKRIEQKRSGPEHQQRNQQQSRRAHIDFRQTPHAAFHARHGRQAGDHDDADNNQRLYPFTRLDAKHMRQPRVHLQNPDPQTGGNPKQRTNHAERIDAVAEPTLGAFFAKHRQQRAAQRQRQAVAIGEIRQCHADQRVNAPTVQAPMQKCLRNRGARSLGRRPFAHARREVMRQRLGHPEKQQVNADTGGEQHRRPCDERKIRLVVILSQFDIAVTRQTDIQRKQTVRRDDQHIVPTKIVGNPSHGATQQVFTGVWKGDRQCNQRDGNQG